MTYFSKLVCILFASIFFTACNDFITNYEIQSPVNGGVYVGLYGELSPNASSSPQLPENLIVSASDGAALLKVYLNGFSVTDKLVISGNTGTAAFTEIAHLLRQGENVVVINPENFGPNIKFNFDNKGPLVILNKISCLDSDCTEVNGGNVEITVELDEPSAVTSLNIETKEYVWNGGVDTTQYTPLQKERIDSGTVYSMADNGDGTFSATVPESRIYSFYAEDEHGYIDTTKFLSEGQYLNNVFKLRIGKTLLDSVIPIVEPNLDGMHMYSEEAMNDYGKTPPSGAEPNAIFDSMNRWWSSQGLFYGNTGMGASTGNEADCGYMDEDTLLSASDVSCTNLKTDRDGVKYCKTADVRINNRPDVSAGYCTRIVIWRLKLDDAENMQFTLSDEENGRVILDMEIEDSDDAGNIALNTDLGMRHIACGPGEFAEYCSNTGFFGCTFGGREEGFAMPSPGETLTQKQFCQDDGGASVFGLVSIGDLKVEAERANPAGDIDARVFDGDLLLDIDPSSFRLNMDGLSIGNGLADAFLPILSGILDGLFVDIVAGVIKQNLTDFTLRFDLFSETGSQMTLVSDAQQVFTNADNNAATPVEWYMYYSGYLDASLPHPDVPEVLGSLFVENEVMLPADNPALAEDNFSIALNANIINQGLTSIYRSGLMHFTVVNSPGDGADIFFEPNATEDLLNIKDKALRLELFPHSPATFEINDRDDSTQATLRYWGAEMNVDVYDKDSDSWDRRFTAVADIKAGVVLKVIDKKVKMTIEGTPQIKLRNISDFSVIGGGNNSSFSLVIGGRGIEKAVITLLEYSIPQVAESLLSISVPDIVEPNTGATVITTTESIDVNNGKHLGFSMGLNLE